MIKFHLLKIARKLFLVMDGRVMCENWKMQWSELSSLQTQAKKIEADLLGILTVKASKTTKKRLKLVLFTPFIEWAFFMQEKQ